MHPPGHGAIPTWRHGIHRLPPYFSSQGSAAMVRPQEQKYQRQKIQGDRGQKIGGWCSDALFKAPEGILRVHILYQKTKVQRKTKLQNDHLQVQAAHANSEVLVRLYLWLESTVRSLSKTKWNQSSQTDRSLEKKGTAQEGHQSFLTGLGGKQKEFVARDKGWQQDLPRD